jgi:hypothetical protein
VATKVYIYVQEEFIDYTLWIVFQEEFYRFTADNFKRIYTNTRVKLRTYLPKRGVYIAIDNNKHTFSEILFDFFKRKSNINKRTRNLSRFLQR